MTIREDQRTVIDLNGRVNFNTEEDIRGFLLDTWKMEAQNTLYRYYVETLSNGKRIYLERPGRLNKGCDFVIFAEDLILYNNGNDKPPKHEDILNDLRAKAQEDGEKFRTLRTLIENVYNCQNMGEVLSTASGLTFTSGWNCETLLKLLKWFFIEQDITYWNGTGREMLWSAIQNIEVA